MSEQRLSTKDFQLYLKTLLSNKGLKIMYSNPTAWCGDRFYNFV